MTNQSRNLYIGLTNNIRRRMNEHKVVPKILLILTIR
ncbi:MAG: GIY-YIG nuclease family protein [Sedimentisphaerales bacterium]|nr:GIY-YIG nuclease family protein [Sedimentisphaerales bacterium]